MEGGEEAKSAPYGGSALSAVGHGCTRKSPGVNAGTWGPPVAPVGFPSWMVENHFLKQTVMNTNGKYLPLTLEFHWLNPKGVRAPAPSRDHSEGKQILMKASWFSPDRTNRGWRANPEKK